MTIIPRGRALGVTMQLPEGDRHTHTREFLEAQIAILMGGRIAEEIFLRQMTSGAGNDIERATEIARRMVCEFGMSTLGPLAYRTPGNPWETERGVGISEATAQRVDAPRPPQITGDDTLFEALFGGKAAFADLRAQTHVWQPAPGHTQIPIWPGAVPDAQPVPGPELFGKFATALMKPG